MPCIEVVNEGVWKYHHQNIDIGFFEIMHNFSIYMSYCFRVYASIFYSGLLWLLHIDVPKANMKKAWNGEVSPPRKKEAVNVFQLSHKSSFAVDHQLNIFISKAFYH